MNILTFDLAKTDAIEVDTNNRLLSIEISDLMFNYVTKQMLTDIIYLSAMKTFEAVLSAKYQLDTCDLSDDLFDDIMTDMLELADNFNINKSVSVYEQVVETLEKYLGY